MKLLLDANLSWRLVKRLSADLPQIEHVTRTGLPIPARDKEIWRWAKANEFLIVTNDEDFANLLMLRGFPPKIILIRRGNQTTEQVANLLISSRPAIEAMEASEHQGLIEIF
jgi:predicted nuclease of predicted toxin-antitoxin system